MSRSANGMSRMRERPMRWFGRAAASLVLDLARMRAVTPYMGLSERDCQQALRTGPRGAVHSARRSLAGDTENHRDRPIEAEHCRVVKAPDAAAELALRHGHQLVRHQPRRLYQTICFARLDTHTK